MPEFYYSPHTGEHINTNTPADWMGKTSIVPPSFNSASQGAFFREGAWVVENAQAPEMPPKQFSSLQFLDLFTEAEQLAIATAAMQSPQVKLWYDRTLAASFVSLADPRTDAGLTALVGAGLLTVERKAAIVGAMQ